jgi:hypothetical protein
MRKDKRQRKFDVARGEKEEVVREFFSRGM